MRSPCARSRPTSRIQVERLEDRRVLSGFTTAADPYLVPVAPNVTLTPLLTVGASVPRTGGTGSYRMVGVPDGLGAFDNGDGTFTVLMNHELRNNQGIVRAHGSPGAFVSRFVIDKRTLQVLSGQEQIQSLRLWDPVTNSYL